MFSRHGIQFAVCVTVALVALPSCQRNWSQPTTPAGRWKIHAGGGTYVGTRPSFSPDATLVVYSTPATGHGDLYLFDRTAGKNIRLTSDPEYDGFAFFAGDRRIVFERERGNIGHLWAMDADGSRQTQLADGPTDDAGAALSKDGRSIVFFRVRGGVSRIWIMDADGGNQRQLTDGVWFDALPHFSPDGRQVVFCRQEETTSRLTPDNGAVSLRMPEVFVINVDGTQLRRLTRNSDYDAPVSYSPDGKLVFIRHMNGVSVMDADGSRTRACEWTHASDFRRRAQNRSRCIQTQRNRCNERRRVGLPGLSQLQPAPQRACPISRRTIGSMGGVAGRAWRGDDQDHGSRDTRRANCPPS